MKKNKHHNFADMKKSLKVAILLFCLLAVQDYSFGQRTDFPSIGAQVFIEPGQSPQLIDSWFECLEKHQMHYARIRLFGSHIQKEDGSWDFSIYDLAFNSARKHGIKLFVTLFPKTDELKDVGGFKFPESEKQLEEVGKYIDAVVSHFKNNKALYAWVLQNEPGTGSMSAKKNELSSKVRQEWMKLHPVQPRDGYLKADFSEQEFLKYYTIWYLNWISERIQKIDNAHYRHVNPHQILDLLPEYDFAQLEKILTSLGASMHLSWHFSWFRREEFPMGISLMADIIRGSALGNPFWITELQGGNVTASGNRVLCPSGNEISQWLWTGIGAGAEGIIFWTLNQRAAVSEAGEWGLLNFQNKPSERFEAASNVAKAINANADIMAVAKPARSDISILYNSRSLWIQKYNAGVIEDRENEGRGKSAVMKSVAAAYQAIASWGLNPEVGDMEFYDWNNADGRTVVLPHIICIPTEYYGKIRGFVKNGGRIIATGLTGYYDETMKCAFMGHFPLEDVFGAECSEVKASDKYFALPVYKGITLDSHLWYSSLAPTVGKAELEYGKEVYAVRNNYGKGEVLWFPAMVDLGNWHRNEKALSEFYGRELYCRMSKAPLHLSQPQDGVTLRTMLASDALVVIAINKNNRPIEVDVESEYIFDHIIYDNISKASCPSKGKIHLEPEECKVSLWKKKQL